MDKIEKQSETEVKITSTKEEIISLLELKAQKVALDQRILNYKNDIAQQIDKFKEYVADTQKELDTVNIKIASAESLGILEVSTEVIPEVIPIINETP